MGRALIECSPTKPVADVLNKETVSGGLVGILTETRHVLLEAAAPTLIKAAEVHKTLSRLLVLPSLTSSDASLTNVVESFYRQIALLFADRYSAPGRTIASTFEHLPALSKPVVTSYWLNAVPSRYSMSKSVAVVCSRSAHLVLTPSRLSDELEAKRAILGLHADFTEPGWLVTPIIGAILPVEYRPLMQSTAENAPAGNAAPRGGLNVPGDRSLANRLSGHERRRFGSKPNIDPIT